MTNTVGIAAYKRADDLSDFGAELDSIEALGVDTIEIPLYELDVIVGGRIRPPQLEALRRACAGRACGYSVHGPLAINFMAEPWRLPRHFEVLAASLEASAALGARHYVIHSGLVPVQPGQGIEAAYAQQREALSRAGDMARAHGLTLCVETLFGGHAGEMHASSPRRLAAELALIDHPNVKATIDFSDSFGRPDDIWTYCNGEKLAYGHGDLHLPVGWGDLPWEEVLAACTFPAGASFTIELERRYWYAVADCIARTRDLARRARNQGSREA